MLELAAAGVVALLEDLAVGVELAGGQSALLHMVAKTLAHRGGQRARIAFEQLAFAFAQALRMARERGAVEARQPAFGAVHALQPFARDGVLDGLGRQRQGAQRGGHGRVGVGEFLQRLEHRRQRVGLVAQRAGQRVERVQRLRAGVVQQVVPEGVERVDARRGGDELLDAAAARVGAQVDLERRAQASAGVDAAHRLQLLREGLGVGAAVVGLEARRLLVERGARGLFGAQVFEDLAGLRTHGMRGEVIAALEFARQAPPRGLQPAQQRALLRAGLRQRGFGVAGRELVAPVGGALQLRVERLLQRASFVQGIAECEAARVRRIEQRELATRGQCGDAARIGHHGQRIAPQHAGLGQRRPGIDQRVAAGGAQVDGAFAALDQPRQRFLLREQRGRELREHMLREAGRAQAFGHGQVQARHQLRMPAPGREGGQCLGLQRRERRVAGLERHQPRQQLAQRHRDVFGHVVHGGVEAFERAQVEVHRVEHLRALGAFLRQRAGRFEPQLVGLAQVLHEGLLVALRVVDHAAQLVQPLLAQAVEHDVDGGALLADEQHALAAAHVVGDQVGDGLRLPRARRALDDVAGAGARQRHRGGLRGVGLHHGPLVGQRQGGRRLAVDATRLQREHAVEGFARQVGFGQPRVVAHQRHLAVVEVAQRHGREVDVPLVGVAAALAQREGLALGVVDRRGRHLRRARLRRAADGLAHRQRHGAHARMEQLQPARAEVVLRVAEVLRGHRHRRGRAHAGAALELLEPLARALVHHGDLGLLHEPQLHAGFALRDLRRQLGVELFERGLAQVHRLGQRDAVELAQVVAQRGVHLRLAGRGFEQVLVAHAFLARQLHRQHQQRRGDALGAFGLALLEVVPAQEGDHQRQLREAVLGPVAPRLLQDAVERAGQVGLVFEAQPARERHGVAAGDVGGKAAVPHAQLVGADAVEVDHQRHAGDGEVHMRLRRLEVQQAVAPRQVEQAVAQVQLDRLAALACAVAGGRDAVQAEVDRLVSVGLEAADDRGQVARALVAVERGHLEDHGGHHRVQPAVQLEQVAAVRGKAGQVVAVGEVEPARQAGQHLA
ncbi:hypothetical protein D9M72_252670 [compost metagenome]